MVTRLGIVLLFATTALGCRRTEPSATTNPSSQVESDGSLESVAPSAPTGVCGTEAQHFDDYAWIPDDSRLTTALLRDDPELPAALATLASMTESAEVQLPIRAALDYRNLRFQLLGLENLMRTIELDPGEVVELHSPEGDVVWTWPTDCPTATLATRMLDRFAVLVRVDFEHPGVRLGAGSDSFPFDFVLLHERLVALAPRGRGAKVGAWLSKSRDDHDGPGAALASIELAPIRSVLSGPTLLADPDHEAAIEIDSARHRKIRATADAWQDGEAASSP